MLFARFPNPVINITEEHILSYTLAYSDPTNDSLTGTKFLSATYSKARTNTFYIHTHTNCAHICFWTLARSHTRTDTRARTHACTHAGKQADRASRSHARSHTLVHEHSITGMYYKYTLQCRLLHFASTAIEECCPSINISSVCAFTVGLWHALQQHDLVSSICYMTVGLLSVCPYWLVITNNRLLLSGWITSDYLSTQANAAVKIPLFKKNDKKWHNSLLSKGLQMHTNKLGR